MPSLAIAVIVNGVSLLLAMYAWPRRDGMRTGPRLLLNVSIAIVAVITLGTTLLLLGLPATRTPVAVVVIVALIGWSIRLMRDAKRNAPTLQHTMTTEGVSAYKVRTTPRPARTSFVAAQAGGGTGHGKRAEAAMRKAVSI